MRNVSDAGCRENQYTQFMINNFVFENSAVDEIIWKNSVEPGTPRTTICRIHIACWIPRATNKPSDYVILIVFPSNNGCTKTPQLCSIHILPVLFVRPFSQSKDRHSWNGQRPSEVYRIHLLLSQARSTTPAGTRGRPLQTAPPEG